MYQPSESSNSTHELATIAQIANTTDINVIGMNRMGAFFFGLYSSPRRGLSKIDIVSRLDDFQPIYCILIG
jgi:hypothetical protein